MAHFNPGMNRRQRWIHKYSFHGSVKYTFSLPEAKMVLTMK